MNKRAPIGKTHRPSADFKLLAEIAENVFVSRLDIGVVRQLNGRSRVNRSGKMPFLRSPGAVGQVSVSMRILM